MELVVTRRRKSTNIGPLLLVKYSALKPSNSYIKNLSKWQYGGLWFVADSVLTQNRVPTTCFEVSELISFASVYITKNRGQTKGLYAQNTMVFYALSPKFLVYYIVVLWTLGLLRKTSLGVK